MSKIAEYARSSGQTLTVEEGGRHTKVKVGDKQTVVPRHKEISDYTAASILKQIGAL